LDSTELQSSWLNIDQNQLRETQNEKIQTISFIPALQKHRFLNRAQRPVPKINDYAWNFVAREYYPYNTPKMDNKAAY